MTETIARTRTEAQAARARRCPLCQCPPGTACQGKPSGDHLARYLDAYTTGQLYLVYLATVLGELVVFTRQSIVRDGAR